MLPVIWTRDAKNDLQAIFNYINERNPWAAERLADAIRASTAPLHEHPCLYRRSQRVPGCREIIVHTNYIVIYRVDPDCIRVIRVVHARRVHI